MIIREARLPGVFIVEPERLEDERGFFARTWCEKTFAARGLVASLVQCSVSYNRVAGTLRGMHFQAAPHGEYKLIRCTAGAIYDVALDLRPSSPTFGQWEALTLSAENRLALYVPEGVAHGFQTLLDDTEVFYQMANPFVPAAARGVRWNDARFGIVWPETPARVISERDRSYADFEPALVLP